METSSRELRVASREFSEREILMRRNRTMKTRNVHAAQPRLQPQSRDSRLATHNSPHRGLTLIELLVVIVILTTLVGGVIPVLSPNNDTRKIRGAARGLQTYINVVQAKAARTGRPHGIALRESSSGSGVALEVFGLEVPPLFAGFSSDSRCPSLPALVFWDRVGSTGSLKYGKVPEGSHNSQHEVLFPQFEGRDLHILNFQLGTDRLDGIEPVLPDPLPPRMFRNGDVIDVAGNLFLVVEHPAYYKYVKNPQNEQAPINELADFLDVVNFRGPLTGKLACILLNEAGQAIPPDTARIYKFRRQPVNSSDAAYQLPAGIVIDMQASIAEGSVTAPIPIRFPAAESLYVRPGDRTSVNAIDTLGIMFSPTGAVDSVVFNGTEMPTVSRLVLMLGRIENAGIDPQLDEFPWVVGRTSQSGGNDNSTRKLAVDQARQQVNWLNADSRLMSIVTNNGRVVVSEPAFVPDYFIDSTRSQYVFDDDFEAAAEQIETAHGFAHDMSTVGGN